MLNRKEIESFYSDLSTCHAQHLVSPAKLLMKNYLNYLRNLKALKEQDLHTLTSLLLGQLQVFLGQPNFSDEVIHEIREDIRNGGEKQKLLLHEEEDLLDSLFSIRFMAYPNQSPPFPLTIRTGFNFNESKFITGKIKYTASLQKNHFFNSNEAHNCKGWTSIPAELLSEKKQRERDVENATTDPEFLALPNPIQKLMGKHVLETRILMKLGFTFNHLQLSKKKLVILLNATGFIGGLIKKDVSIDEIINLDEERLSLILKNPAGTYNLLKAIKFKQLETFSIKRLELLVENPSELLFLLEDLLIPFTELEHLEIKKLKLLLDHSKGPVKVLLTNWSIPFTELTKLEVQQLEQLLECPSSRLKALLTSLSIPFHSEPSSNAKQEASHVQLPPQERNITQFILDSGHMEPKRSNAIGKFKPKSIPLSDIKSLSFLRRSPALATKEHIAKAVEACKGLVTAEELLGLPYFTVQALTQPKYIKAMQKGLLKLANLINRDSSYIYHLTTPESLSALEKKLFTAEDLTKIHGDSLRQILNTHCLKGLRNGLFTINDLANLGYEGISYISRPECLQALRDRLFTVSDFKGVHGYGYKIFLYTRSECLLALREGRTSIEQLLQMDNHEVELANKTGVFPNRQLLGPPNN
jgi:hypothetical protein